MTAVITVTPTTAPLGTSVEVKGTGFKSRLTINLYFNRARVGKFKTTLTGEFLTNVEIPLNAGAGVHTIKAITSQGEVSATVTATAIVEPPPPPPPPTTDLPPPPIGWDTKTLQQLIDVMPVNGILNLNGRKFTETAIVAKDGLTIVNGSITKPGATLLVVKADGVVIRDVSTHDCYQSFVLETLVDSFELDGGSHLNYVYFIVRSYSAKNVKVHNTEIGFGSGESADHNAYGVGAAHIPGQPPSSDWEVTDNYVHDSVWHGLDTHGGHRIAFRRNTVRNCRRGIALTTRDADLSQDCIIEDNNVNVLPGYVNPYFNDRRGIWLYRAQNVIVRRNEVGSGINPPYDDVGGSTIKEFTGNTWNGQPVSTWA